MHRGLRAGATCIAAALAIALAACGDQATGDRPAQGSSTLTVYSSLPMHGPDGERSRDMVSAIKLALQEGGGKVGKLDVTYVALDSSTAKAGRWTRDKVLDNARQAVRDPNTIAYIGDLLSEATALALPLVNEGHILQVSPGSTYDGLTRPGGTRRGEPQRFYPSGRRTFGRVVAPDHAQAAALVSYMKQAGVRRVALARDRGLYGSGVVEQLQKAAAAQGLTIVKDDRIEPRVGDLSSAAQGIASSHADAFLFAGEDDGGAARIFSAVAAADPKMLLFAPSGVAGGTFVRGLTAAAQRRMRITTPTLPASLLPGAARSFVARFRATFGREPVPDALLAFEATKLVLGSIRAAGGHGNNRDAVVKAFFATRDRRSAIGDYSIDRYGDPTLSIFAGDRVRGGRMVLDKVLKAAG